MRTIAKKMCLLYGCQMLLGSLGMALYCYLDPNAFGAARPDAVFNMRLFLMTAGLVPNVGLGLLLIWLGLPSRSRMRTWRAIKRIIEN